VGQGKKNNQNCNRCSRTGSRRKDLLLIRFQVANQTTDTTNQLSLPKPAWLSGPLEDRKITSSSESSWPSAVPVLRFTSIYRV
jgi:hypothetical protein